MNAKFLSQSCVYCFQNFVSPDRFFFFSLPQGNLLHLNTTKMENKKEYRAVKARTLPHIGSINTPTLPTKTISRSCTQVKPKHGYSHQLFSRQFPQTIRSDEPILTQTYLCEKSNWFMKSLHKLQYIQESKGVFTNLRMQPAQPSQYQNKTKHLLNLSYDKVIRNEEGETCLRFCKPTMISTIFLKFVQIKKKINCIICCAILRSTKFQHNFIFSRITSRGRN